MDQLRQVQSERKAERSQQMEQAMLLAQLSLSKGIPYNPADDFASEAVATRSDNGQALSPDAVGQRREPLVSGGFVYSSAEINRAIDRKNRLTEAKLAVAAAGIATIAPIQTHIRHSPLSMSNRAA
jgi:hypothetical protein